MLFLRVHLVLDNLLPYQSFCLILLLHIVDSLRVDELQLLDTILCFHLLLMVKLVLLSLVLQAFILYGFLLLFTTLFCNCDEIFAVQFSVFEIHLALFLLLLASNQRLLIVLLLGLLRDEFGSETFLSHTNLVDLLLIVLCQEHCIL